MPRRSRRDEALRINITMERLGLSAYALARESGVDHSLISKWQQGSRPITRRSKQLLPVVKTMVRLDEQGLLEELYAPYCAMGETPVEALLEYLVGRELSGLPSQMEPPERQVSGEYTVEYRVFLGQQGFRSGALTMMEYLEQLPPGRELIVVCQGRYEWITGNIPFVLQFIARLRKAVSRGTRLLLVNRRGYSMAETAAFAGPWLLAHLHGYVRSRYYDGELPENLRFVASIPGFWCAYVEEDPVVEDSLYLSMHTDPKQTAPAQQMCEEYITLSKPASQYNFLKSPRGDAENACFWEKGPLPRWRAGQDMRVAEPQQPDGSFYAVSKVPAFGLVTMAEFKEIVGKDRMPDIPEYLFAQSTSFAPGPHKIILCREDVREAIAKQRRAHEAFSLLLGRRAFVTRYMFRKQMERLLAAMSAREDIEVALVPRVAFTKLQLELVCWRNSVAVGHLQDLTNSVFADDEATSGAFYGAIDFIWDKLLASWKRKKGVQQQLRSWLRGRSLDEKLEDSSRVETWDIMPGAE